MSEGEYGHSSSAALGMAMRASEQLRAFFQSEGAEDVCIAPSYTCWVGGDSSHPMISIFLPKDKAGLLGQKVAPLITAIRNDGVIVAIHSYEKGPEAAV